jgi:hypothetical protein
MKILWFKSSAKFNVQPGNSMETSCRKEHNIFRSMKTSYLSVSSDISRFTLSGLIRILARESRLMEDLRYRQLLLHIDATKKLAEEGGRHVVQVSLHEQRPDETKL